MFANIFKILTEKDKDYVIVDTQKHIDNIVSQKDDLRVSSSLGDRESKEFSIKEEKMIYTINFAYKDGNLFDSFFKKYIFPYIYVKKTKKEKTKDKKTKIETYDITKLSIDCQDDKNIESFIKHVKDYGFPFKKYFLPDVKNRFQHLVDLLVDINISSIKGREKYFIRDLDTRELPDPKRYKGFENYIKVSEETYLLDSISDNFQEHVRIRGRRQFRKHFGPSIESEYYDHIQDIIKDICKANKPINVENLRETLFALYGRSELTTFKPTLVISFINVFKEEILKDVKEYTDTFSVLDISAGWGDRLLGCMAEGVEYTGVDPNIDLQKGYKEMIDLFGDSSKHRVIPGKFEDVAIDGKYTFAISSPPYFDLEVYVDTASDIAKDQSIHGRDVNRWYDEFLLPSCKKVIDSLYPGGIFVLNIADVDKDTRYTARLVNELSSMDTIEYYGVVAQWVGWNQDLTANRQKAAQPFFVFKKIVSKSSIPAYIDITLLHKEDDIFEKDPLNVSTIYIDTSAKYTDTSTTVSNITDTSDTASSTADIFTISNKEFKKIPLDLDRLVSDVEKLYKKETETKKPVTGRRRDL